MMKYKNYIGYVTFDDEAGIFHGEIINTRDVITFQGTSVDEIQKDLDDWLVHYNNERTHQGKMCCGRTPMGTFLDGKKIWKEKVDTLNLD